MPCRGIYDNMKTVVNKVNKGKDRMMNARFAAMGAYYKFDPDFYNAASGWENGIVEKNVQGSHRRIWLDAQGCQCHSLEELNALPHALERTVWASSTCLVSVGFNPFSTNRARA